MNDNILTMEYRIGVLEKVMDKIMKDNPKISKITQEELDSITIEVISYLSVKYPKSTFSFKN